MEKEVMTKKIRFGEFRPKLASMMACAVFALLALGYARLSFAQAPAPKTFASPGEACAALFQAVQSDDEQGLQAIIGAGKEVTSSSDDLEDKLERDGFVQKYQQMHRLVREPDKTIVLYVGAENWPFPFPLVAEKGRWHFDSRAGSDEVLYRRIGQNEAMTIGAFRLLVLAQQEHHATLRNESSVPEYATRFIGVKGSYNGLDWKEDGAVPQALVRAGISDQASGDDSAVPYYGYYFRILTAQGKHAPGGVKSYISNGKMTGGFAFVAYPAEYRSSGVKTFMAGPDGIVYEKDLGPETIKIASSMTQYDPDRSWHVVNQ
jgi:Protein of unknown function (DUF2950)